MKFGTTDRQRREQEERWKPAFAWLPVKLWDGSWIWWEPYFVRTSNQHPEGGPRRMLHAVRQRVLVVPERS